MSPVVDGENVRYGEQIIEHDAKAILESGISDPNRPWFDDVKKTEKQEGSTPCFCRKRDKEKNQSECHDLVPDNASVIRNTERIASLLAHVTPHIDEHRESQ